MGLLQRKEGFCLQETKGFQVKCIGIDGESIAPFGYCLLASSSGRKLSEGRRLTSRECFDFILGQSEPGIRLFGYGIGYDVCHWVKDLSSAQLDRLATKGLCYTMQGATVYRLTYRPNAYFTVQEMSGLHGSKVVRSATIVDLMRWHRRPFVDVCEEWRTVTPGEYLNIRTFKANRERFGRHTAGVEYYCAMECEALRKLGEEMTSRLSDLGIPVSHPFTSGAVAGALMARNRVQDHWQEPPEEVSDAVSRAFFGGREQCSRYGHFTEGVTQWDIRSAYGWAMTQLPDMAGMWLRDDDLGLWDEEFDPKIKWSLCKVQWDIDEGGHPVMPFPWRAEDGRVHYPPRGTGWHWSPVARAAIRNYPDADIRILDAWHFIPSGQISPFGYIGDIYKSRRDAGNDPVGGLLKSIIVATWGRLCSPGRRPSKTRGQLAWAGMVTALIQERMLDAIHATGEAEFISACVDGFWTTSRKVPRTNERGVWGLPDEEACLGSWSRSSADELLLLRPACYWKRTRGEWSAHTAGIPGGNQLVSLAAEQWRTEGWRRGRIDLTQRRVKGLLACSADGDYDQLGQFVDLPLSVSFNPGMGRMGHECPTMKHESSWRKWLSYWPPSAAITSKSASFVSRTGIVDDRWKERQEANAIEETQD